MKTKRNTLIFVVAYLFIEVILLSFKILNYSSLISLVESKLTGHPICKNCNIILISLDTLSANHLPCYGYGRNTAPNLCKFGKENIMFENAFSNASWTLPSHVSIFTGLYPSQHGVIRSGSALSSRVPFLPEILQNNGYKTYLYIPIGDWAMPIKEVYDRGIDKISYSYNPKRDWTKGLEQLKENNTKGQKTFLFLHTYWVHDPYILENENRTIYAKDMDSFNYPKNREDFNKCTPAFLNHIKKALKKDYEEGINGLQMDEKEYTDIYQQLLAALPNEKSVLKFCEQNSELLDYYYYGYNHSLINEADSKMMNHLKDLYDSKIVELDEYLKDVFSYVQNSNLKDNTIIIVTSDHGEEFMEHGSWAHGINLYDTTTKIPLMMYIPGQKSKKVAQVAQSADIVPTLLDLLNIKNSYIFAGSDLFTKNIFNAIKYVVAQEQREKNGTIRDNEWKLFYQMENGKAVGVRLFNYKKDPQEKNDVLFTNNAVVERLLKNVPK